MRFLYKYQDREGRLAEGEVSAPSVEAAYSVLRKGGVRPMKVWQAPGILNRLSLGKRWAAIFVLSLVAAVAVAVAVREHGANVEKRAEAADVAHPLSRCQVDAALADAALDFVSERTLARFASPGREVSTEGIAADDAFADLEDAIRTPIRIGAMDSADVSRLKGVVTALKDEARMAIQSGDTPERFLARLVERQRMEADYRASVARSVAAGQADRESANATLRLMGMAEISTNEVEKSGLQDS